MIATKGKVLELNFNNSTSYIDVISPSNTILKIPTFLTSSGEYAIRFIPKEAGKYRVNKEIIEVKDSNLEIKSLKLSKDKSYLELNNRPFFWLSDTWWMALSGRLEFNDFKELANIRKEQGFNTIQLVAGLMPDMNSFDLRGTNEGGFAWEEGYKKINPNFFDVADKKIEYLYNLGFNIALVGSWGYYLEKMGLEKMKEHWRYIIARWGAYTNIYIAAGEATMPYYLSSKRESESKSLKRGWSKLLEHIKEVDPHDRLLTIHPIESSLNEIKNDNLVDINLLQASHDSYNSVKKGVKLLNKSASKKLTIMDEINYEGIFRDNHDSVQRLSFWSSVLNGSKGFGYGANGIWQVNQVNNPFGPSPSGAAWGDIPYTEAIKFKGAKDLAKSKEFLEDYEWWKLKSVNILTPTLNKENPKEPYVATIDNTTFIAYFYNPIAPWDKHYTFKLEPNSSYSYYYFCPNTYIKTDTKDITTNNKGEWKMDTPPSLDDWVLVITTNTINRKKRNSLYLKILGKLRYKK